WPLQPDPRVAARDEAIRKLPPQASVSTAYTIDTHLTHRPKVYEFPVPWCDVNWGLKGEHLDNPDQVQWLLIDRELVDSDRDKALLAGLLAHEFRIRFASDDIVLAQRIAPPVTPARGKPLNGQCFARPALKSFQP
ncbi:MAG TPA: hypothetical protein VK771_02390, partial [Acidimicrobiia bacterium]|nr:hypothetical protein [Acidimicrobiia bacterium]